MHVALFTAALDDRFGQGVIASRIGLKADAQLFNESTQLFTELNKLHNQQPLDCILIDEAQFLTREQVMQLTQVVDELDIPVLAYGLRTDFTGETFSGSHYLLAWADKMVELKTVCHCGRKANFVVRMDENGNAVRDGEQVAIGGNDKYVSMCRQHFRDLVW